MVQLLTSDDLPPWFRYPAEFSRIVNQGLLDLDPWFILNGDALRGMNDSIRSRYSTRPLVPFAKRADCDDVACRERSKIGKVIVVDISLPEGLENDEGLGSFWQEYDDFWTWFRQAIEDMIEYAIDDME